MISNRPELVDLRECLEVHGDEFDLLYLTDSEASLQAIHKWIGYGAKLNLSKSPDADVLKAIILKFQKRVETGGARCKEHVPRDGNDWTEDGQMLLEDPELWLDRLTFLWTSDWLLTEGESRDKLG